MRSCRRQKKRHDTIMATIKVGCCYRLSASSRAPVHFGCCCCRSYLSLFPLCFEFHSSAKLSFYNFFAVSESVSESFGFFALSRLSVFRSLALVLCLGRMVFFAAFCGFPFRSYHHHHPSGSIWITIIISLAWLNAPTVQDTWLTVLRLILMLMVMVVIFTVVNSFEPSSVKSCWREGAAGVSHCCSIFSVEGERESCWPFFPQSAI